MARLIAHQGSRKLMKTRPARLPLMSSWPILQKSASTTRHLDTSMSFLRPLHASAKDLDKTFATLDVSDPGLRLALDATLSVPCCRFSPRLTRMVSCPSANSLPVHCYFTKMPWKTNCIICLRLVTRTCRLSFKCPLHSMRMHRPQSSPAAGGKNEYQCRTTMAYSTPRRPRGQETVCCTALHFSVDLN